MRTIVIESLEKSGCEIALHISQETGLPFIDSHTILSTAEKLGADVAYLKQFEEKNFGSLIYSLFSSSNRFEQRSVQNAYSALAEAIRILYHQNKGGIFMGRFAAAILSEFDSVFIAYIYSAPMNLSKYYLRTPNTGKPLIQPEHKRRRKIFFSMQDDDNHYDVIFNTTVTSIEDCAKSIIQLAKI